MEVPVELSLSELERLVLLHLYTYGPDTPKLMARRLMGSRTRLSVDEVEAACASLERMGLVERYRGSLKGLPTSSVKPWIKVKARGEPRARGVYYSLTREGRGLARLLSRGKGQTEGHL